ncbi:mediator complex subunit [Lobaria immixta]|nr:mediator complex subunit [Lobaria immixta]
MMDDDLDELFGDAPQLQLPPPVSKGLLQCVDDLRLSGCCQKIAWSKFGCIAYITHDGRRVNLRHLLCDPQDGQWKLSETYLEEEVSTVHSDHQIVHLSWNPIGNDIAIVDVFGQISIFSVFILLNRIHVSRKCAIDPEDHLNAVVGLKWLNTDRVLPLYRPGNKKDGIWHFMASKHNPLGPLNPNGNKSALVAITRGGAIRLLAQGQESRWQDIRTEVDSVSSSSGLLSHAALSPDKDSTMLLVTHSIDKQLRLYRVGIDCQQLVFNIQHLKTINDCSPMDQEGNSSLMSRKMSCQMSHLELIPPGPEMRTRGPTSPFALAVFSYVPDHSHDDSVREEPFSILARWEFHGAKTKLHPSFEQLTSKRPNFSSPGELPSELSVKRSEDVVINRLLLSLQDVYLSTILVLTYGDGSIEFRDRTGVGVLPRDDIARQVSSMYQVGFDFSDMGTCLHTALSPNLCAAVSLSENYDVKLGLMQLSPRRFDGAIDLAMVEAATESFVLQFAIACTSHSNHTDDLLAVMQSFLKQRSNDWTEQGLLIGNLEENFLSDIYRVLGVNIDHSVDPQPEQLFRNQMIQKCLSMQMSLGYPGERQHRSLSSKVALTILNLRFASLMLAYSFKKPSVPRAESDFKKPEVLRSLLGLVSWSMALMSFITDELFTLGNLVKVHGAMDKSFIDSKIREMNTPALALVLSSTPRSFLKYNCRYLRVLSTELKPAQVHGAQRLLFDELGAVFKKYHVTIMQFDRILSELDSVIKNAYVSSQMSEVQRKTAEKEMLVAATVPSVLVSVLESFLTFSLDSLREEVNEAELFFSDTSWLGLSDDRRSDAWRKDHVLDVFRKVELPREAKIWRCTRCGAVMEHVRMLQGSPWSMNLQRWCLCGAWWMMTRDEDVG